MVDESQGNPDIFGRAFQVRMKERLLRDPLHGLIAIDESSRQGRLLVNLIDSAEFQRLRRVRQLGLAHLAFQGAEHSRFTHSIGAFHLMQRIVEQLGRMYAIDSELGFYACVAALLHDVGHGPLSHVFERFSGCPHETWTARILHDPASQVNQILSDYTRSLPSVIESMLSGMAKPGYLCSLVSSQLDVDRLDYLLRDSLMTGVKYGIHDIDRLVHMLRISPEGDRIIIGDGGIVPVEKYIQARYHMYRQVYLHKTVVAAEAMLMALLRRARDLLNAGGDAAMDREGVFGRTLRAPDTLTVSDYLWLDDAELFGQIKRWSRASDPILSDLASRLLERRLFKTLEIDPRTPDLSDRIARVEVALRRNGLDPAFHLISIESSDTPYGPYDPTSEKLSDHIFIEWKGKIVDVADVSPTLRAFTQSSYTLRRLVFPGEHGGRPLRTEIEQTFSSPSA